MNFNFLVVLRCDQDSRRSIVIRHCSPVVELPYNIELGPRGPLMGISRPFVASAVRAIDEQVVRIGMLIGEKRFRGLTFSEIHTFVQESPLDLKVNLSKFSFAGYNCISADTTLDLRNGLLWLHEQLHNPALDLLTRALRLHVDRLNLVHSYPDRVSADIALGIQADDECTWKAPRYFLKDRPKQRCANYSGTKGGYSLTDWLNWLDEDKSGSRRQFHTAYEAEYWKCNDSNAIKSKINMPTKGRSDRFSFFNFLMDECEKGNKNRIVLSNKNGRIFGKTLNGNRADTIITDEVDDAADRNRNGH